MSALTSLLVRDGVVPVRKIEEALQQQVIRGGDVETVLLELDAVPENVLAAYRAAVYELPPASRGQIMEVPPDVLRLVPAEIAVEERLVPLGAEGRALHVALHEPLSQEREERIAFLLGFDLVAHITCEVRIAAALATHYGAPLAPRIARLVARVDARAPGPLPIVGGFPVGRQGLRSSELPNKNLSLDELPSERTPMLLAPPRPKSAPVAGPPPSTSPVRRAPPPSPPALSASHAARAMRRLRGPMPLAAAERMLQQANDRDALIEVLFSFAQQFFDYTALFLVHDDVADGRAAYGPGAPVDQVLALTIPLDRPSLFAEARRTKAPQVRRLDRTEIDRDIAVGLRRPAAPPAFVMPIAIRQRVVLIVYGDRDGEEFDVGAVLELVRFGPRIVEALEQLILRRKRKGYHSEERRSSAPPRRSVAPPELKQATLSVARTAGSLRPSRPPKDSGSWSPGRRGTNPGFAAPPVSTADDSWGHVARAPEPVHLEAPPRQARPRRAAVEVEKVYEPVPARPGAPPRAVLGLPRSAPPPPRSAELDLSLVFEGAITQPPPPKRAPADEDDDAALVMVDGESEEGEPELSFDADAEADGEPELAVEDGEDGDDDDEDAEDDHDDADREDEDYDDEEDGDYDEEDEDDDARGARPRLEGVYRSSDTKVDVVRSGGPPTSRSSGSAARPPGKPRARDDESDASRRPEVVRVPDSLRASGAPSRPPRGMDADTRSVIVDMGEQVHAQVGDLVRTTSPEEQDKLIDGLMALGDVALPILAQAFPGPLTWGRETLAPMPRGRDLSPVARALVAYRDRAVPYVSGLLSSAHPDVRFYASLVAAELVHPGLLDAVAERIHDDDAGVRHIAVQLLASFASMPGFEEIRTVVRRTARIRGKELSRRHQAVDALAALRDVAMVPKLIELLREDDPALMEHLVKALLQITGQDFGTSHRKWESWYERHRAEHRVEWLIAGLLHADEHVRRVAGEEIKRVTHAYFGYHHGSPRKDRERVARKYREWWDTHRDTVS